MADIDVAGLENLDLASVGNLQNQSAYIVSQNLSPERLAQQELLDSIISEVNRAGTLIVTQSQKQAITVNSINEFNNNKEAVNDLLNYYSIQVLHDAIDYKEFQEKSIAAQGLIANPNGALLEMMFENEGGYNSLAKENKAFLDTLDYDNTLDLYTTYLQEKNSESIFSGVEGVSEEDLQELVDLKQNPNPDRLEELLENAGGEAGLLRKAGIYHSMVDGFDSMKDELSKFEIKKKDDVKLSNNSKLKI